VERNGQDEASARAQSRRRVDAANRGGRLPDGVEVEAQLEIVNGSGAIGKRGADSAIRTQIVVTRAGADAGKGARCRMVGR